MSSLRRLLGRGAKLARNRAFWVVVVCLIILLFAVPNGGDGNTESYSVNSAEPDGLKAMVLMEDQLGVKVQEGTSLSSSNDVALLLNDILTRDQQQQLSRWVNAGGVLISADPSSDLNPVMGADSPPVQTRELVPNCSSPFVDGVERIRPVDDRSYSLFATDSEATTCFVGRGRGAFMAVSKEGLGTIVQLGGPEIFTNGQLGDVDNSVLIANLLASGSNGGVVALKPDLTAAPSGDKTIGDLISDGVKQGIWQLAVAAVVLAFWRSRRLGKPVHEPQPVELPGSALVVARGDLLQHAKQAGGAARAMRADLKRTLAELMGLSSNVAPEIVAQLVSQRTGIDERRLLSVLLDGPVPSDETLLALAQAIEDVKREVSHAR